MLKMPHEKKYQIIFLYNHLTKVHMLKYAAEMWILKRLILGLQEEKMKDLDYYDDTKLTLAIVQVCNVKGEY